MDFEQKSQFKETEIGNLPNDWNLVTLKEACSKIGSGITPRGGANVYTSEGTALIRSQNVLNNRFSFDGLVYVKEDMAEEMKNVTVEKRDLLLNITGDSVARCCTVHDNILPARVNQHVTIVRTNGKELDSIFLKYYLTSPTMQNKMLSLAQSGGTRNALTKGMIENFVIPKPNMNEQKTIARILSILDSKIELNLEMNRTLEAVGAAVFKRWFVDFEFPNEEGKPYKSSGGKMVESEIGSIPKGWTILGNISEACEKINYGYTQSASTEKIGPHFLRVMDINKANWIDWGNVPFCEINEKDKPKYLLGPKDIVIARMADPGKIAIYESDLEAVFASYLIRIRLKEPHYGYYFYYLMKSPYYQNFIEGASTGSVQMNLNAKSLTSNLPIVIPSKEAIKQFDTLIGKLRAKINCNLCESKNLAEIRDGLLPKLMSGKIRVPLIKEKMESVDYA
jgi:type I restriction enzyme, S subunit